MGALECCKLELYIEDSQIPYIKPVDRVKFDSAIEKLQSQELTSEGELNYILTRVCHLYLEEWGWYYRSINSIVGALECCKLELYRRIAAPYEDNKIQENGDVPS